MEIFRIIVAAFFGILGMTVFSYAVSAIAQQRYKEPELLNYLIIRWKLQVFKPKENTAGWIVHYLVGIVFVVSYETLWLFTGFSVSWGTALLLGLASGLIGLAGWKLMFASTRRPPKINFPGYYLQLMAAHVVFALTVVAVYKWWPLP